MLAIELFDYKPLTLLIAFLFSVAKTLGAKTVGAQTLKVALEHLVFSEVITDQEAILAIERFLGKSSSVIKYKKESYIIGV